MEEKFATALSERDGEEAIKEISLKIKSVFPTAIQYILVFFTHHYNPLNVLKTINFTLRPSMIIGIQTPFLVFDERIIEKGIGACCLNKKGMEIKEIILKSDEPQRIETSLHASFKNVAGEKKFLFSFLTHHFNPSNYIRGVELALGKTFPLFGGGYTRQLSSRNCQVISTTAKEGIINIVGAGAEVTTLKIEGFVPLGEPLVINRVISESNIIMEINNKPAIDIYKYFLEEKFEMFKKHFLFPLYPLGIKENGTIRLLNVTGYLEDGSLVCLGEVKQDCQAHIMFLHPPHLFATLDKQIKEIKKKGGGIVLMINSLIRKKMLKDRAQEELQSIKNALGEEFKIIGFYSDYSIFPNAETKKIHWEAGNILMTVWR
ncbi:MAG: FIST C-terminal domain-containing protein [Candidatus Omnitrophota bacterium]|nr:MAG: FIST C-terminal domain-containing protein [Candidatus Omnitrophota bacterium]